MVEQLMQVSMPWLNKQVHYLAKRMYMFHKEDLYSIALEGLWLAAASYDWTRCKWHTWRYSRVKWFVIDSTRNRRKHYADLVALKYELPAPKNDFDDETLEYWERRAGRDLAHLVPVLMGYRTAVSVARERGVTEGTVAQQKKLLLEFYRSEYRG